VSQLNQFDVEQDLAAPVQQAAIGGIERLELACRCAQSQSPRRRIDC
jgi:hypothetical protein